MWILFELLILLFPDFCQLGISLLILFPLQAVSTFIHFLLTLVS